MNKEKSIDTAGELQYQLVYTKRTSAQSIYSRVRLHISTRG